MDPLTGAIQCVQTGLDIYKLWFEALPAAERQAVALEHLRNLTAVRDNINGVIVFVQQLLPKS